ncbi:MAG: DUF4194 domain-containing protein [Solimonas sp.]
MLDIPRPAGSVLVHLFHGPVERDRAPDVWRDLIAHQHCLKPYCAVMGLDVHIDEAEGFAFLRQQAVDDTTEATAQTPLPRLIARHNLSFRLSVLLVQLRKRLLETDAGGGDTRCIVAHDTLIEELRLFWPAGANDAKTVDKIEQVIKQALDFNLLRKLKVAPPTYEVRRLTKALVDAQWLAELDAKLTEYRGFARKADDEDLA